MTMHKQVLVRRGFAAESAAKCEQLLYMDWLRPDCARVLLDHVVEAEFEFLVLAKNAEYLGHGPIRVEDGQKVTDARGAVPSEFI